MNFFGVLGQLGRMLPGYVDGRRQAIEDNWNDSSNFSQIRHGQLKNAYDTATMEPQILNMWNSSVLGSLAAKQGVGNFNIWEKTLPHQLNNAVPLYNQKLAQNSLLMQFIEQLLGNSGKPQSLPTLQQPTIQQPTSIPDAKSKLQNAVR